LSIIIVVAFIVTLTYFLGVIVDKYNVKVNYTRKIFQFATMGSPYIIFGVRSMVINPDPGNLLADLIGTTLLFSLFSAPIRKRLHFVATMFKSIDRPEDRPYTLFWSYIQMALTKVVFFVFVIVFGDYIDPMLLNIPMIVTVFGDGLAEPVGVRFGRHKYEVNAFFSSRKYVRSIEGSLCVFLTSIVALLIFYDYFPVSKLVVLLVIFPITMTLIEAKSPHTVDAPFLVGGGCLMLVCVVFAQLRFP
jgi:dolichol kinase